MSNHFITINLGGAIDKEKATREIANYLGKNYGAGILIQGCKLYERTPVFQEDQRGKNIRKYSIEIISEDNSTKIQIYSRRGDKTKRANPLTDKDADLIKKSLEKLVS